MNRLRVFAAGALMLLLGACKDGGTPTTPHPQLSVTLSSTASEPASAVGPNGEPMIACTFTFEAQSSGDPDARADWRGGVVRYFVGTSMSAVDSLVMTAAEVQEVFGPQFGPTLHTGARMNVSSRVPFTLLFELRYRVVGSTVDAYAVAHTGCGRPVSGSMGPPPAISGFSVAAPPGDLEPGDTVRVTWTATGSPSVWQTGVEVIGAFQDTYIVQGNGQASGTYTVDVVIPPDAQLFTAVRIRAYALDLWARSGVSPYWTGPVVVDRTAPAIIAVRTTLDNDRWHQTSLVGQYAPGDTVRLWTNGSDNHQLAYMVYQFGAVRDSVALAGLSGFNGGFPFVVRPEMTGATDFRVHFRDVAGNRSPDVVGAPGAMRVYPVRAVTTHKARVPERPVDVVVDARNRRVYALLVNTNQLRVFSLPGMTLLRTVTFPFSPTSLELTADGDTIVASASHWNGIAVMDVNATAAPPTRMLAGVAAVYGLRIGHTGQAIALARMNSGISVLMEVDLGAGTHRELGALPDVPQVDEGIARSLDRRKMLLGAGCLFDVHTLQVGACRQMEGPGGPMSGDATGQRWARYWTLFDAGLQPLMQVHDNPVQQYVGTIPAAEGGVWLATRPGPVRVRPDGLYVERLGSDGFPFIRFSDDQTRMAGWTFQPDETGGYPITVLEMP